MDPASASETTDSGFVLWLMGPTSSGKTTIGEHLLERLRANGTPSMHFDGDEVRAFFGPDLGFEASDRQRVVATLIHLANKTSAAGVNVIVSALTANEDARRLVLDSVKNLMIVYIKCSIETCAGRDPKGLYAQAKNGEIDTLIGVNSDYLPPDNPDLVIDTEELSPAEAVDAIIKHLDQTGRG
jgi:adenylylsulfate kinase-like enzyme